MCARSSRCGKKKTGCQKGERGGKCVVSNSRRPDSISCAGGKFLLGVIARRHHHAVALRCRILAVALLACAHAHALRPVLRCGADWSVLIGTSDCAEWRMDWCNQKQGSTQARTVCGGLGGGWVVARVAGVAGVLGTCVGVTR